MKSKIDDGEILITVADAARRRGVTSEAIRHLIKRGRMRSVVKYGRLLVSRQELLSLQKLPPGPKKKKG